MLWLRLHATLRVHALPKGLLWQSSTRSINTLFAPIAGGKRHDQHAASYSFADRAVEPSAAGTAHLAGAICGASAGPAYDSVWAGWAAGTGYVASHTGNRHPPAAQLACDSSTRACAA